MSDTLGVVQIAQNDDSQRKKLSRRIGGKSLLEWVVRRVTECQRLDQVVVVIADLPEDRLLLDLIPADIPVYLGQESDDLARLSAAFRRFPAKSAVRIRLDQPFIDPVLIDQLVNSAQEHPSSDYLSFCARGGRPAILSPLGVFAEWFRVKALQRAEQEAKQPLDRCHVTRYLYTHPERFNLRLLPVPTELDRDDVRLILDSEEDWEHVATIVDALGTEHLDWQRIAGLLNHQPAIRERMAELNRVTAGSSK